MLGRKLPVRGGGLDGVPALARARARASDPACQPSKIFLWVGLGWVGMRAHARGRRRARTLGRARARGVVPGDCPLAVPGTVPWLSPGLSTWLSPGLSPGVPALGETAEGVELAPFGLAIGLLFEALLFFPQLDLLGRCGVVAIVVHLPAALRALDEPGAALTPRQQPPASDQRLERLAPRPARCSR